MKFVFLVIAIFINFFDHSFLKSEEMIDTAKNKIQEIAGGRKDYKIDCLAAEFKDWEVSWDGEA